MVLSNSSKWCTTIIDLIFSYLSALYYCLILQLTHFKNNSTLLHSFLAVIFVLNIFDLMSWYNCNKMFFNQNYSKRLESTKFTYKSG